MDKKKELVIGTILVLVFVGGVILSWPTKKVRTTVSLPATTSEVRSGYTMKEVGKHKTTSDCWLAINGSVYDATAYASKHPGGIANITDYCGTDASNLYNGVMKHGARASADLATLLVGTLQ